MPAYISIAGYSDPPRIPLLSLEVNRGEMVAVAGPPGSGKTSLVRSLAGLRDPVRGAIRLLGERPGGSASRFRSVFVFQDDNFAPDRSVWSQLVRRFALWGGDAQESALRLEDWCDAFGLIQAATLSPAGLNLCQLRLFALAPVAICRPAVAILDEPLVGIPADHAAIVMELLHATREKGTVLVMTQKDSPACGGADRVVIL